MKKVFSFEVVNSLSPREIIIEEFIPWISDVTKGNLYGRLDAYGGPIVSYETDSLSATIASAVGIGKEEKVYHDIQKELGEIKKEKETYEFFIGSEALENYKYRVFFIRFGKAGYPAKMVLDSAISQEIRFPQTMEKSYIYRIDSMQKLREILDSIRDSDTFFSVLQEAINASILESRRKAQQLEEGEKGD